MIELAQLYDICDFLDYRRRPIKESDRVVGPYPYYGANGLQGWVNEFLFDESLVLLAEDGGHFGSKDKPIAYKIHGKTWVNNHAHVLRPKQGVDIDYLHHALSYFDVARFLSGSTRLKLTKGDAENIAIPLPSLLEQRRVANHLAKADRIRRMRRYAQTMSDTFLQSVFLEMFGEVTTNRKNWPIATVEEICKIIVDCPHSTPKFSSDRTSFPCIRTSDIQNGYLDWGTTKYVTIAEYTDRIARHKPAQGDIVYTREGERFGLAGRVPHNITVCLGQRMMLLQANSRIVNSPFLWALLNSKGVYEQAQYLVGGSTSPHVNVGDIKSFRVFCPPLKLQETFSEIVTKHEQFRYLQLEASRQADHLFHSLIHQAFSTKN